jgi:hypothetical protein
MHEHKWKITSRIEPWKESSQPGLLMAYEVKVNRCECGDERKVKTAPKGTWWRGITSCPEKVKTYPEKWRRIIADCILNLDNDNNGLALTSEKFVRNGLTWAEADELSRNLVMDGCAEKFERYRQNASKNVKVIIPVPIVQSLKILLGLNAKEKEEEEIEAFFHEWERNKLSDNPIGNIISELAESWRINRKAIITIGDADVLLRSRQSYKLILETLRTIASLNIVGETIAFRELSVKVCGNTKGLLPIKSYLKRMLGNFEDYGITEHAVLIYCKGSIIGNVDACILDLSAAVDYAVLTEATASRFKPTQANIEYFLLIENQTSFEAAVSILPANTCCVFLSGYPPRHVQSFIKTLLTFKPVTGKIWCDMDPDGIEIALTAGKLFESVGAVWQAVGMDSEIYLKSEITKSIDERDRNKIRALKERFEARNFYDLLNEMEKSGKKVEQETISPERLFVILSEES